MFSVIFARFLSVGVARPENLHSSMEHFVTIELFLPTISFDYSYPFLERTVKILCGLT